MQAFLALLNNAPHRAAFANALQWRATKKFAPILTVLAGDSDAQTQKKALSGLQRRDAPQKHELFVKALQDPDAGVCLEALQDVNHSPDTATRAQMLPLVEHAEARIRVQTLDALSLYKTVPLGQLVTCTDDPDDKVRIAAASALGLLEDPRAVVPLIKLLSDPNYYVREAANFRLAMHYASDAAAKEALKHPPPVQKPAPKTQTSEF